MNRVDTEQNRPRATVVGAGFAGLASAHYLERAGFHVEVIEESERPGGLISTLQESFGLVETAANGLLNSALVEDLFSELGLKITPTLKEARRRYIFRAGQASRWPLGWKGSLRVFSFLARFGLNREKLAPRPFETVKEWAERVFGTEGARYVIEASLQGIYAGDSSRMSASLIFGRFFKRGGDKLRAPRIRGSVSAPQGMGELIEVWRTNLEARGVRFRFRTRFQPLAEKPSDLLVLAVPPREAAAVIENIDRERAQALRDIEALPLISVTVAYDQPAVVRGFGCLFPPVENRPALGVLMNDCIFPNRVRNASTETWILGGAQAQAQELLGKSDDELVALVREEGRVALKAGSRQVLGYRVTRWPKALPHYTVELERQLLVLSGRRENVILAGNYLGQIGLAKILESASKLKDER